jgi:asparagine synthase (glutamine-hydrolysing)
MCGIAGIWNRQGNPIRDGDLNHMVNKMKHRGPDAKGSWVNHNLGLGHSRLKILDLSDNANQPFTDGKDVLVFNGEIFNFKELKKELPDSHNYKTTSDTEVLFKSLQHWGVDVLNKIEGQFAFAFFNKNANSLLLARDHVGICPLYVMENDKELIFASEIKPILELRKSPLDYQGVLDYFSYRYNIQNGHTLFSNIKRFHPAHYWLIDLEKNNITEKRYWRLKFSENEDLTKNDFQKQFNSLFDNEIQAQTIADVPVGMYLSGGIDSGALLNGFSKTVSPINTFTIGFSEDDDDLKRVNSMHHKIPFNKNILSFNPESLEQIEDVVYSLEEPFGDLIICANYLLASQASRQVKVVLSGEGGDESFMGYDHQRAFLKMLQLSKTPLIGSLASMAISLLPPRLLALASGYPGGFGRSEHTQIKNTFSKMNSPLDAYLEMITLFKDHELKHLFKPSFYNHSPKLPDREPLNEIFAADEYPWQSVMRAEIEQLTLIVNLLKQERLGMRFSLEGRVPLVSRSVLNFAASLPFDKLVSKINKEYLLGYSESSVIKKNPFSVFANPEYKNILSALMDKYITRESVTDTGILNWIEVKKLTVIGQNSGLLEIKKAMVILVFVTWLKVFRKYIII